MGLLAQELDGTLHALFWKPHDQPKNYCDGEAMKDPDDMSGFTDTCYRHFCCHHGYGWPVEKEFEYKAHRQWNDVDGINWRAAYLSGQRDKGAVSEYHVRILAEEYATKGDVSCHDFIAGFRACEKLREGA
jgi:hypothetical protein